MPPGPLLAVLVLAAAPAGEQTLTLDGLARMSRAELEALYCCSPPAPVLDGYFPGRSMRLPRATGLLWKGKQFCAADGRIINRWCLGITAIKADVYPGESWFDGKPSLIMDYRRSSKVWSNVRDELREVAPGLYLGIMYKQRKGGPQFATFFTLEGCTE